MKLLVIYSSIEGQTLKIAKHLVSQLGVEQQADFIALDDLAAQHNIHDYDSVLIGASVRYGKFRPNLYKFLAKHQQVLESMPVAFFGVCLTARKPEKSTPTTSVYMKKLNLNAVWMPELQAVFAGALLYSKYNFWQTKIIQLIMRITGGSTDTSKDIELTDWSKVDKFAIEYTELLQKHSN
ncbi:menaquinone-dependent protoporphyrinogen IX dehydrogenase [Alginatibacterium sediminis]|uniref:menaquinone-dependent protoporphyrinogen IX dehydrogenase n=1 Tax=Alginatibacterium sediminis TaxID=2164068 RepID=UPI001F2ED0C1|nr:menaquinone-dependent protoporphyrinogen IX dehydrogenase [Alginatibacterium sediminis]